MRWRCSPSCSTRPPGASDRGEMLCAFIADGGGEIQVLGGGFYADAMRARAYPQGGTRPARPRHLRGGAPRPPRDARDEVRSVPAPRRLGDPAGAARRRGLRCWRNLSQLGLCAQTLALRSRLRMVLRMLKFYVPVPRCPVREGAVAVRAAECAVRRIAVLTSAGEEGEGRALRHVASPALRTRVPRRRGRGRCGPRRP